MTDDFSTLMPAHKLVIERARQVCDAGRSDIWRAELNLRVAIGILDTGNHGMAKQILDGLPGPFPPFPPFYDEGEPDPDKPHPYVPCEDADVCFACSLDRSDPIHAVTQPEEPEASDVGRENLAKGFRR